MDSDENLDQQVPLEEANESEVEVPQEDEEQARRRAAREETVAARDRFLQSK